MATDRDLEKPEPITTESKSDPVSKLGEDGVASGKAGMPSDSTSVVSSSGDAINSTKSEEDATSSIKDEIDRESVGENGAYNQPTSTYNYYYPGYGVPFMQGDNHGYFQADGSHTGVYYLPGYNPYASGPVVGVDGQSIGQQSFFSSSGYLQQPVSYGSEAVPCYSWDSTYVSDVSNGQNGFGNAKYGSGPTTFTKSNGLNSMTNNSKFSKSSYTQPVRHLNKVSPLGSDLSTGLLKGCHSLGKFPSLIGQKQGLLPHNGSVNYKQNGRIWNGNDRNRSRDKFHKNGDFENSRELTCGPRASNKNALVNSSVKKEDLGFPLCRDRYNLPDFETEYADAKFYVIKSYNEDDIHKSIKYDVWASTPYGNKKLNAAFHDAVGASESGTKCPIFLFFSVNGSGQFVGLAEMVGQVDFDKDMDFWQLDKWNGFFPVKWHIIKDIPNAHLRHIILENSDNNAVTFSRDTQEVGLKQGLEMLNIFKSYSAKTSLLDDFNFYENREKSLHTRKTRKPATLRMQEYENGEHPKHTESEERRFEDDVSRTKKTPNPSSLINQTKNLSINGLNPKNNPIGVASP